MNTTQRFSRAGEDHSAASGPARFRARRATADTMAPPTLESNFFGCMVGTTLGDALGELASVHDTREDLIDWVGEADSLRYTDETAVAIGLAEAISDLGDV
jgi:hypothetical protein